MLFGLQIVYTSGFTESLIANKEAFKDGGKKNANHRCIFTIYVIE